MNDETINRFNIVTKNLKKKLRKKTRIKKNMKYSIENNLSLRKYSLYINLPCDMFYS